MDEYIDELTGVCLTVEQDNPEYPGYPKITVICPDQPILTISQINEALSRLRHRAGIPSASLPDLVWRESAAPN